MKLAISVVTALLVIACGGAQAVVLEGVGHATIYNDDVDSAAAPFAGVLAVAAMTLALLL